jgi:hypothetical protein
VTASEPTPAAGGDERSIAARALDVLVYLPAGAFLTAIEEMPETVAKGRARVDQELRNARVVGSFAVGVGWRQLKEQIEWVAGDRGAGAAGTTDSGRPRSGGKDAGATPTGGGAQHREHRDRREHARTGPRTTAGAPGRATPRPVASRPATPPRDPEVDRAIPDYDILAASQVVRRLDGLGHQELRAVIRHEGATRGRRTILHRAEQLLGGTGPGRRAGVTGRSDAPGAPGAGSDSTA